jgi:hypothetical protein
MATSELSSTTAASSGARLPAFTALAIAVAVLLIVTHGVSFLAAVLPPPRGAILDFFKEWASARNRLAGVPVYAPQIDSLRRHLGMDLANPEGFFDAYNTHPPLSVVLALPIAGLNAHFAWKWISLGCLFAAVMLILRESSSTPDASDEERAAHGSMPWLVLGLAGILVCDPLLQTLIQGQPTLVIGLLLVLAWRADRHGQSLQSGLWCGLATLIKLYPGLLLVHFLVRRDGRGVLGFVAGIAAGTAISVAALGWQAHVDYVLTVLPAVQDQRNNWGNVSVLAFWDRIFGAPTESILTWRALPDWGRAMGLISAVAIIGWSLWLTWKDRRDSETDRTVAVDRSFSALLIAMTLCAPLSWQHGFVLLLIPLAVLWRSLPERSWWRVGLVAAILALWLPARWAWDVVIPAEPVVVTESASERTGPANLRGVRVARPWQSLTALSYQTYALIGGLLLLSSGVGRSRKFGSNDRASNGQNLPEMPGMAGS